MSSQLSHVCSFPLTLTRGRPNVVEALSMKNKITGNKIAVCTSVLFMKCRSEFTSCGNTGWILTSHVAYRSSTGTDLMPPCSRKSVYINQCFRQSSPRFRWNCQPESAPNFIPLNCWIRMPPWLLSLGAQLFLIGGLRAEPTKRSVSFDLPGLCSLIQTEQCET